MLHSFTIVLIVATLALRDPASAGAQTFNTNHSTQTTSPDALTNAFTLAESARQRNYREGLIDFPLIRQTDIRHGAPVFPPALKALDGKTVRIIGFMNPYDSLESMKHCLIWERNYGCYFCKPPGFLEAIYVHQEVKGDEKPPFINSLVMVTGTLRLWKNEDDYLFLIEHARAEAYDPDGKKEKKKRFLFF